ncbi:hypothetical protein EVAR_23012_1 [Eumeta japonica]|uniref:Uncharacterized protein n=1 Tax=Eumeta variegata TaxID=151549 RepID=A0A4C1URA0_EUMVA|nr:hypothetical protein EVAR_23012_1 [Eumeta japonica]
MKRTSVNNSMGGPPRSCEGAARPAAPRAPTSGRNHSACVTYLHFDKHERTQTARDTERGDKEPHPNPRVSFSPPSLITGTPHLSSDLRTQLTSCPPGKRSESSCRKPGPSQGRNYNPSLRTDRDTRSARHRLNAYNNFRKHTPSDVISADVGSLECCLCWSYHGRPRPAQTAARPSTPLMNIRRGCLRTENEPKVVKSDIKRTSETSLHLDLRLVPFTEYRNRNVFKGFDAIIISATMLIFKSIPGAPVKENNRVLKQTPRPTARIGVTDGGARAGGRPD